MKCEKLAIHKTVIKYIIHKIGEQIMIPLSNKNLTFNNLECDVTFLI